MRIRFTGQLALVIISLGLAWRAPAQAQTFSVVYNFGTNFIDPTNPNAPGIIAQGRDGNLYSTTPNGSTDGFGAMFKVTPGGVLTVPFRFGVMGDNVDPHGGLTLGTDGNFYGTTSQGGGMGCGGLGCGTVFKVTPSGTLTVLHSFAGYPTDGSAPSPPPIQGTDGNFYGTTEQGGTQDDGTVYKVTPEGEFATLYSFDGRAGGLPFAPLVQGTDGNFYGTTPAGGNGYGTVYKITPSGKVTVLYYFDVTHGASPYNALVHGSDGNFYGTTLTGGINDSGVIFKITAAGKLTVLHNFYGLPEPCGLVQATDGNLYGTTFQGGAAGYGTIFRISPTKPYLYEVLHTFSRNKRGFSPLVAPIQHTNGILYGDTEFGGTGDKSPRCNNCGTFYSLNIGAGEFVSLVSTAGKVGKSIGILGQGFNGTTGVAFNGTRAAFKVVSSTYLTAKVPSGATTGFVTVTTPTGKLTSNKKFRVN